MMALRLSVSSLLVGLLAVTPAVYTMNSTKPAHRSPADARGARYFPDIFNDNDSDPDTDGSTVEHGSSSPSAELCTHTLLEFKTLIDQANDAGRKVLKLLKRELKGRQDLTPKVMIDQQLKLLQQSSPPPHTVSINKVRGVLLRNPLGLPDCKLVFDRLSSRDKVRVRHNLVAIDQRLAVIKNYAEQLDAYNLERRVAFCIAMWYRAVAATTIQQAYRNHRVGRGAAAHKSVEARRANADRI